MENRAPFEENNSAPSPSYEVRRVSRYDGQTIWINGVPAYELVGTASLETESVLKTHPIVLASRASLSALAGAVFAFRVTS